MPATVDVPEDLLLVGAREDRVVMGSLNRGGPRGASFGHGDRRTGHRPQDIAGTRFGAGRLPLRVGHAGPDSPATLEPAARAVDAVTARRPRGRRQGGPPPAPVHRAVRLPPDRGEVRQRPVRRGGHPVRRHGLGPGRHLGPHLAEAVLPAGGAGDSAEDRADADERCREVLAPPAVQGLVVGRSLLHPAEGSVGAAVDTAVGLL